MRLWISEAKITIKTINKDGFSIISLNRIKYKINENEVMNISYNDNKDKYVNMWMKLIISPNKIKYYNIYAKDEIKSISQQKFR